MQVVSSQIVYENPWLRVIEDTVVQAGEPQPYAVVERADSVVVIPLSRRLELVLLRQERHPTRELGWELPGGSVDDEEEPRVAAERELREETSLQVIDLIELGSMRPLPGLTSQRVTVYVAPVSDADLADVFTPRGTDEIVSTRVASVDDAVDLLRRGDITDGLTISSLLMLKVWIERQEPDAVLPP